MAASMLELNDDCLEYVLLRLDTLKSELNASQTCRRFQNIIFRMWHYREKYRTLSLEEWRQWLPEFDDLKYFIEAVCDVIKVVKVNDECLSSFLRDFKDMAIDTLPNVGECIIEDEIFDCYPNDDDIMDLTKLLPNLRCLYVTAPITGRHLANLNQLEELYLYEDQEKSFEIEDEYLEEICNKLTKLRILDIRAYEYSNINLKPVIACTNLETLKTNLNPLKTALNEVLQLPRLKTLTVLLDNVIDVSRIQNVDTHDYHIYETDEFFSILSKRSENIVGVYVDNYYMPLLPGWDTTLELFRYQKLQEFAFCNCDFSNADEVLQKYTVMPQLRLLCLRNWRHLTGTIVLKFIEMCPHLEHLDISYCNNLGSQLLRSILTILEEKKRTKPLKLYTWMSSVDYEIEKAKEKFWDKSRKVVLLRYKFPPNSEMGLSFVGRGFQFNFE